jgi:porphobilinogen synthase
MAYPMTLRRLRQGKIVRGLVREVRLSVDQLMQPLFVVEGLKSPESIAGLTQVYRETETSLLKKIESDLKQGVSSFLLFGVPEKKATKKFSPDFTARQIAAVKRNFGTDLFLAVDVCLCSSSIHGQCGVLNDCEDHVQNDSTVVALADFARAYAEAGADCIAPSDMMDGRIKAIRESLKDIRDDRTLIMSYAAKFHSRFYGPFRVAADSAPQGSKLKDRSTYQIDPTRPRDAYLSAIRDVREGADILMVKPGLAYLDVLWRLSRKIQNPWAVYEVSGEFAAIELMSQQGLVSGPHAHVESWVSFVRAGAQIIITYGARSAREWLKQSEIS